MPLTRDAEFFTFFLRVEPVLVAAAAAVPEAGAALGLGVVIPLQHKVPAGALVLLQPADIHGCGKKQEQQWSVALLGEARPFLSVSAGQSWNAS